MQKKMMSDQHAVNNFLFCSYHCIDTCFFQMAMH